MTKRICLINTVPSQTLLCFLPSTDMVAEDTSNYLFIIILKNAVSEILEM